MVMMLSIVDPNATASPDFDGEYCQRWVLAVAENRKSFLIISSEL